MNNVILILMGNGIDIEKIARQLSLEQKIMLLSGLDMWHLQKVGQLPLVRLHDGPTGIRMVESSFNAVALPSTCYPTSSAFACSWDRHLLFCLGEYIADEATAMGVHIVLAPGINIKRNPLCGRNFEYFSEDPFLTGELAKNYVNGVQIKEAGVSLKHFAANSQETLRSVADSIVDERALREIYLAAFETVVRLSKPATVMCAYNKLNGEYCSQNYRLLTSILRDEWGYEGVVISDWGAVHDRVEALKAGLDIEMPGSKGYFDDDIIKALKDKSIDEQLIDKSVKRIIELIDKVYLEPFGKVDYQAHDDFAYNAACASAVLLKNQDGILPLSENSRVVVMGEQAVRYKFQGCGSSKVNPRHTVSPVEAFSLRDVKIDYYKGYGQGDEEANIAQALQGAQDCDAVIVFAGYEFESECIDRTDMRLGSNQESLINALVSAGHKVIVVLCTGSAVEMDWADNVHAVLQMGLAGQCSALAAVDILYGLVNPQGRLAESYPFKYSDVVNWGYYCLDGKINRYRESIYVGYRYYEKAGIKVRYPFGYGLSYSNIEYSDMVVKQVGDFDFNVSVSVKNLSERAAHEVIQLYVEDKTQTVFRPVKELKGFEKVYLQGGETQTVTLPLNFRSFAYYDDISASWQAGAGDYVIHTGCNINDIKFSKTVKIFGDGQKREAPDWYFKFEGEPSIEAFDCLYGKEIKPIQEFSRGNYTLYSTLGDIKKTIIGKFMLKALKKTMANIDETDQRIFLQSSLGTPFNSLTAMSEGAVTKRMSQGLIDICNRRYIRGIIKLVGRKKRKKLKG